MNELLEMNQIMSVVPQDFRKSNKGKVVEILDKFFALELLHNPDGIEPKKTMEFYSQTKNGMLYFNSVIIKVEGNKIVATMPRRHRFLQRRAFTRVKFMQDFDLKSGEKTISAKSVDLSAGGLKLMSKQNIDIDSEYSLRLNLIGDNHVDCVYEPLKVEKNDEGDYTLAGRFKNLSRTDRMKIIQFCIRKDVENANR